MPDARALIAKLDLPCRQALEKAAERAMRLSNFAIEPEHLLLELCAPAETDIATILSHYGIPRERVAEEIERSLGALKGGSTRVPALSDQLLDTLQSAWLHASVDLGLPQIRSGLILHALLNDDRRRALVLAAAPQLATLSHHRLTADLPELLRASREGGATPQAGAGNARPTPALDSYTVDLTAEARAGRIDPVIGRDPELRQILDILMRRRQNNPILTGDAGVGKTAIVEGFAQRVADGNVPPALAGMAVRSLDLGLLQAGAGMRGEFEQRLRTVIDEIAGAPQAIVLFIDEAHTLIGAGGQSGQGDAANLLKPALARGALRTIAATTWGEYKRYIEKDPALARRFQVVKVAEPSESVAVEMLRGLTPRLERHHGVRILDRALQEAVRLSHRYIPGRQLPDKAISVLDTAAARVAVAQSSEPALLEDARRHCAALEAEIARLRAETMLRADHAERLEQLADELARAEEQRHGLAGRWELERETVARLRAIEVSMAATPQTAAGLQPEWEGLRLELDEIQQSEVLVPAAVDDRVVAEIVSGWTGIPTGAMRSDSVQTARGLKQRLADRIVGQDAALDAISRRIQTFYAELGEPGKPTGVFLLSGPSGVGKTETALALAEQLFGGTRALITVNMSEYQEAHSVSGLKGAPPGYVGYGSGGVLTEAVRRRPYAVLLLDEVEKAHPDVLELFYQVFDRGMLEDSEGQLVDFSNTVILLTSNVGAEALAETRPDMDAEAMAAAIRPALLGHFPAAFLGRLIVVPYRPLGPAQIETIVRLKLARVQARFAAMHGGELTYDEAVVRAIATRARQSETGARTVDAILTHSLLPDLSSRLLDRLVQPQAATSAHIRLDEAGGFRFELDP